MFAKHRTDAGKGSESDYICGEYGNNTNFIENATKLVRITLYNITIVAL
jgi:hypothetical protein